MLSGSVIAWQAPKQGGSGDEIYIHATNSRRGPLMMGHVGLGKEREGGWVGGSPSLNH